MLIKRDRLKKGMAKEVILQAAESVFAQSGYDGTTVDKIAEQAGVTKKLLYYHFRNKHEILIELLHRHADDLYSHIDEIFPQDMRFSDKYIGKLVDNLLTFLKTKQNIIKIFLIEFVKENELGDDRLLFSIMQPLMSGFSDRFLQLCHRRMRSPCEVSVTAYVYQILQGIVPIFTFYAYGDKIGSCLGLSSEMLEKQFSTLLKKNMKQFLLISRRGQYEENTKISDCHYCSHFDNHCILRHTAKRPGDQQ